MSTIPPLPAPADNQPAEARRVMAERFIKQARAEIGMGNRLQAGEKAWGAVTQYLKIIGEERGWQHTSNRQLESIGRHIRAEYPEHDSQLLGDALSDAYHKGHRNFYENWSEPGEVEDVVEGVEAVLPVLDTIAGLPPRPFRIDSNSELRRLRLVTGDNNLQRGDESPVGFSRRHGLPDNPSVV